MLRLGRCSLSGPLSEGIGKLSNLVDLRLNKNSFEGPLPDSLNALTKLIKINMKGSGFDEPYPQIYYQVKQAKKWLQEGTKTTALHANTRQLAK